MIAGDDVAQFLHDAGWDGTKITPLQADFSSRKFARIERAAGGPRRAILMQAAPDQKTPQFIVIANLLRRCGLSVPEIYATCVMPVKAGIQRPVSAGHVTHTSHRHATLDSRFRGNDTNGESNLVLMEDFGDTAFGKLLDAGVEPMPLYRRAADVLVHLHQTFDPAWTAALDLPSFNAAMFAAQTELFLDYYFPHVRNRAAGEEERETFLAAWLEVLAPLDALPRSFMLRDFMPDNVMNLPEREGWRSTGLLDFQDGGLGPVAYDIASLCECVRRDAPLALLDDIVEYYHDQNAVMPLAELRRACYVLSAQRHARVLGILMRLAETQGRKDMLAHISRVRNCLDSLLRQEALKSIKKWAETHMKQ
jgi:N-acetylmuramate 1-kinase